MTISKILVVTAVAGLLPVAAFAAPLEVLPEPTAPFAISLGVTFSGTDALAPDTLSASVATGGTSAVSNATAAVIDGARASSSNGGATQSDTTMPLPTGLNSQVQINDNGFESTVGTGGMMYLP